MTTETKKYKYKGLCKHCHEVFLAQREEKIYCSNSCKQKAYMERIKAPRITAIILNVEKKPTLRRRLAKLLQKFASLSF